MENDQLKEIDRLLTKAKRHRDNGSFEKVVELLERRATPLIMDGLASATPTERIELGRRLADCYGLQGGCYRRWALDAPDEETRRERLAKSVESYSRGEKVESDSTYGIASTYNLLNKVISQILLDPNSLSEDGAVNVRGELEKIEVETERQKHRDDSWFLADKALVDLLLDKNMAAPKEVYSAFLNPERIHPYFVYESMLATLRPLAQLDLSIASKIKEAVSLLDARRQQLQQG